MNEKHKTKFIFNIDDDEYIAWLSWLCYKRNDYQPFTSDWGYIFTCCTWSSEKYTGSFSASYNNEIIHFQKEINNKEHE